MEEYLWSNVKDLYFILNAYECVLNISDYILSLLNKYNITFLLF